MQPRAYLPSPVGVGFAGIGYSRGVGGLLFDASLPVEDGHVDAHMSTLSVGGTLGVFGRTTQLLAVTPYVAAHLTGKLAGNPEYRYRSGLADTTLRFSINLRGAPAMKRSDFARYRPRTILGVSLTATIPAGQYDPALRINIGTNRWGFKPEIGLSRSLEKWIIEGAFGVWLYSRNGSYLGRLEQTQSPLWSSQAHLVRIWNRRMWLAFDFTYFAGGKMMVENRVTSTYQSNTRIGGTYGFLLSPRQALRFTCFTGVTTRVGTDITSVGMAYQFIWASGR